MTGEELDRSWRWQAQANGEFVELEDVWPVCAGNPITEQEYRSYCNRQRWAREHVPESAYAEPRRRLDLFDAQQSPAVLKGKIMAIRPIFDDVTPGGSEARPGGDRTITGRREEAIPAEFRAALIEEKPSSSRSSTTISARPTPRRVSMSTASSTAPNALTTTRSAAAARSSRYCARPAR